MNLGSLNSGVGQYPKNLKGYFRGTFHALMVQNFLDAPALLALQLRPEQT